METSKIDDFEVYSGLRFRSNFVYNMSIVYKWLSSLQNGVRGKSMFVAPSHELIRGNDDDDFWSSLGLKLTANDVSAFFIFLIYWFWLLSEIVRHNQESMARILGNNFQFFVRKFFQHFAFIFNKICSKT